MTPGRLAAAAVLVALLAVPALSRIPRAYQSETHSVSIDGRRFVSAARPGDDEFQVPDPFFGQRLREDGEDCVTPPLRLPAGVRAEHTLRMETASGPVTLAFGRIETAPATLLNRLKSAGWVGPATGPAERIARLATITTGKETRVVLLDEKERRFLLVLRLAE